MCIGRQLWIATFTIVFLLGLTSLAGAAVSLSDIARIKAKVAGGETLSGQDLRMAGEINRTTKSYIDVGAAISNAKKRATGGADAPRRRDNTLDDYVWQTVTYDWVDASVNGTFRPMGDDENVGPFDMGINFPFYGTVYNQVRVCSNGFLTFESTVPPTSGGCPPTVDEPNAAVYMFWTDLNPENGGSVFYWADTTNHRFIVEFREVPHFPSTGSYTFEAILNANGDIVLQWQAVTNPAAIVGVEDANGAEGISIYCGGEGTPPQNGTAIRFYSVDGVPQAVTNLTATASGLDAVLNWNDPTHDTNGNPITPDSILIYRGVLDETHQIGHVSHGVQTYFDADAAVGGNTYFLRAKLGTNLGVPAWVTIFLGGPSYRQNFDSTNGGWVSDGLWDWGAPFGSMEPVPHSLPNLWCTALGSNYPDNVCHHLDLAPGMPVMNGTATVEFWYWYQTEYGYDGCNFKVSADGGANWILAQPEGSYPAVAYGSNPCIAGEACWTGPSGNNWQYAVIPIGQYLGDTLMYRFSFGSDVSATGAGFYIDDFSIWGLTPPIAQAVVGVVKHSGPGNPPLEGARVWVEGGQDTVVTDLNGVYLLPMDSAGTYAVHLSHPSHCDSLVPGFVVQEGEFDSLNVSLLAPEAHFSVTSMTFRVFQGHEEVQTFTISNDNGDCPLHFAIVDTSSWLTCLPSSGLVNPTESREITVTANVDNPPTGDAFTMLAVWHNATDSPYLIRVDLNVLGIGEDNGVLPTAFALGQNFPNPFNATTMVPFDVPRESRVEIAVFNLMGQEVARPVNGVYRAGRYQAALDLNNVASGVYLIRMNAGAFAALRKIVMLK